MSENDSATTVEAQHIKSHGDGHEVYESPSEPEHDDLSPAMVGTRVATDAIGGEPIDFLNFAFSEDGMVDAELQKETKNYAVYGSETAIDTLYISRERLGLADDEDAPETIGVTVTPSDEDAFGDAADEWAERVETLREAEADAEDENLLAGAQDEDAVEVESDDVDEDEAETLLAEAEEAAE